jgi:FAD/FMN-containing dehydrogenase
MLARRRSPSPPLRGSAQAGAAAERHAARVARVAGQLRDRPPGRPVSLKKRSVSHQVPKARDRKYTDEKIDLTDLDEILELDVEGRTCTAEPGVTFTDLVDAALPFGLVPIVVPELKTITVGGAVSGCSLESMSFQHGGFHDTCLAYDVVTATGEILHVAPDNEYGLVFQMMHGAFGTLGIVSRLTFRLVPALPWVHVVYETYATLAEYQAAIWRRFLDRDVDFMDGLIHGPSSYVLSLGRFIGAAPYTNRYDWMKVYSRSTLARREDYLRTADYFFRYDNGVTNVHPRSAVGRLLLGKFLHSSEVLRLAETLRGLVLSAERPDVTVDLFLPFSRMAPFLAWYERAMGHYPLWCVPYRRVRDYEWLAPEVFEGVADPLYVDLAVYGMKQPPGRNIYKELEHALPAMNGLKTLISHNFYEPDAFWRTWNHANYTAVKKLTDPHNVFRDLYSKTCRAARGLDDVDVAAA